MLSDDELAGVPAFLKLGHLPLLSDVLVAGGVDRSGVDRGRSVLRARRPDLAAVGGGLVLRGAGLEQRPADLGDRGRLRNEAGGQIAPCGNGAELVDLPAARSGKANSRPIQASIWAIPLTSEMRSRRAIRESCSDAGMVVLSVSKIAFVSSSTNSGTPSVRAMIVSTISCGRISPPSRATIASTPRRPSLSCALQFGETSPCA
jgi:hypothetical protein